MGPLGREIGEVQAKKFAATRPRVIELTESEPPPQVERNQLRARCAETRSKLEKAFRQFGMTDAEAKIAAAGR